MADAGSYGARLKNFWAPDRWAALWLLFGLMPLFFFETFVHEGLHWLEAVRAGGDPTLIPFAHFNTSRTLMRNINGATLDTAGFVAAPQIVCLIIMAGLIALFIYTSPRWRWLRMFLTWWYLGLVLDVLFNTWLGLFGSPRDGTDWYKFANEYGYGWATLLSWLILLVVLSQLFWITISRWHENRPPGIGFFEYRGVAVVFAIISLIALIVSHTVDDPSIVRNWWFWAVWLAQLASFGWYVVYFVWATARKGSLT